MEKSESGKEIEGQLQEGWCSASVNLLQSSREFSEQQCQRLSQFDSFSGSQLSMGVHSVVMGSVNNQQSVFPQSNNQQYCTSYHLQATQISILKKQLSSLSAVVRNQQAVLAIRKQKVAKVRQIRGTCNEKDYELLQEVTLQLEKADVISTKLLAYSEDKLAMLNQLYLQLREEYWRLTSADSGWEQPRCQFKPSQVMGVVTTTIEIGCEALSIYLSAETMKVHTATNLMNFRNTWTKTELALCSALKDIHNMTPLRPSELENLANLSSHLSLRELLEVEKNVGVELNRTEKVLNQQQFISRSILEAVFPIMDLYLAAQDRKMDVDAICHFTFAWMNFEKLTLITEQRSDAATEYYCRLIGKLQSVRRILRKGY